MVKLTGLRRGTSSRLWHLRRCDSFQVTYRRDDGFFSRSGVHDAVPVVFAGNGEV